ncbi:DUF2125 domain-containing protein [Crenalkalicoccus roseus]|uniref:DUF2125 domain-containing protein n=1 Tax=Crenalkalicoccus roseus TaxID=1485588 RepID=UPI00108120A4|nr:DUF2125 domain-containing protein [Crenalkalicoccus roseus]
MPAKPPSRGRAGRLALRALTGLALLLALAAAGHAVLWRHMATSLERGFAAWAEARRAQGWRIEHGPAERGGWPFSATLALPGFRMQGAAATLPGGMDWRSEGIVLRLTLPRLDRLVVEMPGRHRLRLGDAEIPFAADRLRATMPIERHVLPREAALEAERLRLATAAGPLELRRAWLEVETRSTAIEGEPALALRGTAEEVALPPGLAPAGVAALGRVVQGAELDLALSGPVPPGRHPADRAGAWRDGGGTLELRSLVLRWGPATATAAATLTLDEALQPMGAGLLRLAGGTQVIEAAAASGLLSPSGAATARMALRLIQRPSPEGGPPQAEVPLTLEGGVLSLARLPLARLPEWRWPGRP